MGTMHHLSVGCADCTVIQTTSDTFLVDCHGIEDNAHLLPKSKVLRAVFVTHQHRDHFDGLQYLKDEGYTIEFLVYSPYKRRHGDNSVELEEWNEFEVLRKHFEGKGTVLRSPYRQAEWEKPWWNAGEARFWILGPYESIATSETRELHDGCLVVKAHLNKRSCLFTGDASDTLLSEVAAHTTHICGDILHASHHGSINGASLDFIKKCSAQYTVISTESGAHENVPHPTALSRYKSHTAKTVYRTDVDGSIKWTF